MTRRIIYILIFLVFAVCATHAEAAQPGNPALKRVHFSITDNSHYGSDYAVFVSARCTRRDAYGDWTARWGNGDYTYLTTGGTSCHKGVLRHVFITTDQRCGTMTIRAKTYDPQHLRRRTIQTFHVKIPVRFCS